MSAEKDHGGYVDKVRGETQAYLRKLLDENHDLRGLAVELKTENARLSDELRVRDEQQSQLGHALEEVKATNEQYLEQYAQLEQNNANLANLYVSSYQLHGTLDRDAVLTAMQEIVVNLIGSEEFAIVERGEDGVFRTVAAVGVDDASALHLSDARIARSLESGDVWLRTPGDNSFLTACVPLKLDGDVTGYIAIFRLLAHKSTLEPLDHELFDLLGTHAATALYCTSLAAARRGAERLTA